jgi:hypothetical protein
MDINCRDLRRYSREIPSKHLLHLSQRLTQRLTVHTRTFPAPAIPHLLLYHILLFLLHLGNLIPISRTYLFHVVCSVKVCVGWPVKIGDLCGSGTRTESGEWVVWLGLSNQQDKQQEQSHASHIRLEQILAPLIRRRTSNIICEIMKRALNRKSSQSNNEAEDEDDGHNYYI